jgi:hypothetical protein
MRQDFLDRDVGIAAGALLQRRAIGRRVEQPVDMIDAQPLHIATLNQRQDQAVRDIEQFRLFDAQSGEVVDVEKPAVIDLVGRDMPVGDAKALHLQQTVQPPPARWAARPSGKRCRCRFDRGRERRVLGGFGQPLFQFHRAGARRFRPKPSQPGELGGEGSHRRAAVAQDGGVGVRQNRKAVAVVPGAEAALVGIEAQHQLAAFQHRTVLPTEHRQQHSTFRVVAYRRPVDVEIAGEG